MSTRPAERADFIRDIIDADLAAGRHRRVATRFPPEPNGYLHIGHAKSICLNFGIARDYQGTCNLRFDDTNPTKEDVEYVEAIERDIRWLGFEPTAVLYASDTFEQMYLLAEKLILDGKAYVDSLSEDQIREHRGSLTEPGRPSPDRERPAMESLDLFRRMRAGEFPDGACTLRAKIDMAAPNMKMRDPLLYRIRHAHHHRTGNAWCIYPMYDYAHPLEDAFESITHSICTLEFENNRDIYDWVIEATGVPAKPRQYEFARLNLDYTVMSKRKLLQLVEEKVVNGWDDPRMPTIAGMRRRGYRPEAIRAFCDLIGVAKNNSVVDLGKLEYCVRDDLNDTAPRALAVLRSLQVTLVNVEVATTVQAPGRELSLERQIFIERDDFQLEPEAGYLRLAPGRTVRLRHAGCITCEEVVTDEGGNVVELRARLLDGEPTEKVWGVLHWVSAVSSIPVEVRLYDRLFTVAKPDDGGDFLAHVNPRSLEVIGDARVEPSLAGSAPGTRVQFERLGYFAVDRDSTPERMVWNRIVGLKDAPALAAPPPAKKAEKSDKNSTRPARRTRAEYRAEARARDPELAARLAQFIALGLSEEDADLLSGDRASASLFALAATESGKAAAVARLMINDLPRALGDRPLEESKLDAAGLAALAALLDERKISAAAARDVLAHLVEQGGDPRVRAAGLEQVSDDGALDALVNDAVTRHADKAAEYRAGKTGLLGFFVGQVVKASQGRANPARVKELVEKRLGS